jgi:hypothetical protein
MGDLNFKCYGVKKNNGYAAPPRTKKELRALLRGMVREIKAMSVEERMASLVSAGIYTKSGKLTKRYRD